MKRNIKFSWFGLPLIALVVFILTRAANRFPEFTETWYSQRIYPKIAKILSGISSLFPFSIDDIFYVFLILGFLGLIILMLFQKTSLKKTLQIILNGIAIIYTLFYALWGFNYFRENLNSRLQITEQEPNTDLFIKQLQSLIENTNNSYCLIEELDKKQVDLEIEKSYKKLESTLKISYPTGKRKDKTITFSSFFAKAGISGYYGPFFNEIHVNRKVLPVEYPFVLAHEKAHQFGITSEAEANFYAWLVCTKSNSEQLQYSANIHILRFFLLQAFKLEEYPEIIAELDENVKDDFVRIRENWMSLRNEKVDKVASKVNDTYLKTNKVEKGIEDYKGVVKYVMDFSVDSVFQEKIKILE